MKIYDLSLLLVAAVVLVCTAGGVISGYFLGHDNKIEEVAEVLIQKETGVALDLSPSTPDPE